MRQKAIKLNDLVKIASMSALLAVCSWVTIPLPFSGVPVTLQTFAVFFAIGFIGCKRALISYIVYLALGAVGVPVFSGFGGGVGHLIGPTGGYLFGFVFTCLFCMIYEKRHKSGWIHYIILASGLLICYVCGTAWFVFQTETGVWKSLLLCVVPYIIPDAVKIVLASLIASKMKKIIKV
ncbi:MAG: biotin transporter BioY [Clostridia bacterium]|nr:biotin transporter BioY [Clostridia bacterium]